MRAQVVSFHCVLKDSLGSVISTSFNRDVITQVASHAPLDIPVLSEGMKNAMPGQRRKITVRAQDAFGLYDPKLTREASRRSLSTSEELGVGSLVQMADSFRDNRLYRVTKVLGDLVYLDANHQLAGQDLVFELHFVDARDATAEEVEESSFPVSPPYLH